MKDRNVMKVNSFGKKYRSYANAFKGKINETKDEQESEIQSTAQQLNQNKIARERNDPLIQMIVLTMEQMVKTLDVVQEILLTVCTVKNNNKKEQRMKQYVEKIAKNREDTVMFK